MIARIVVAVVLFAVLAGVAWWLEHRRRNEPPPLTEAQPPMQVDRADFPRPDAPFLVVLFTSSSCASCAGLFTKAAPLESPDVAVVEIEYTAHPDLHERYKIEAAPLTVVADQEGVVHTAIVGAFSASELWSAVAELRDATA